MVVAMKRMKEVPTNTENQEGLEEFKKTKKLNQ